MSQLAIGNRAACSLDTLELDQSSGRLEADFTLRHQHTWPTLRDAQIPLRAALGPIGTDVEDLADLLPDPLFDGARKYYHKMDLEAHDAHTRAYEAETGSIRRPTTSLPPGKSWQTLPPKSAAHRSTCAPRRSVRILPARKPRRPVPRCSRSTHRSGWLAIGRMDWNPGHRQSRSSSAGTRHGEELVAAWSREREALSWRAAPLAVMDRPCLSLARDLRAPAFSIANASSASRR